jgi:RNA polymerase sigma factor (sigma-70 family)
MAADPRRGPSTPTGERRLGVEEASFYASVFNSARKGSLNELRRAGCSEEEAEELFSEAFRKVMETVDPIARGFSEAQMVNFIKRSCWRLLIDERRRRGLRPEVEIGAVHSLSDASAESPEEVAEEREAIAIGKEALQMLSERDRVIFRQRHQMNLSPQEILQNMPGLSLRTYRKVIQRANTRVLDAFERIEGGERCEEMEAGLLRRYVADESPGSEQLAIEAHLAHCRACQQAQARMRGYLFDVASGLAVASSLAGSSRVGALGNMSARLTELASDGAQALGQASRSARERLRDMLFRVVGGLGGSGGDATVGQALAASSAKVASACAAGLAAGACLAAGVVPGVGGIGLLGSHEAPAKRAAHQLPASERPSLIDTLPTPSPAAPAAAKKTSSSSHKRASTEKQHSAPSTSTSQGSEQASPSSARISPEVTSNEFGAESGQPVSPVKAPAPSSSPSGSSGSSSGGGSGSSSKSSSGSEFGL